MHKLKSVMVQHDEDVYQLAKAIGMSYQQLLGRLNGRPFKPGEINAISKHYKMTPEQIVSIFIERD